MSGLKKHGTYAMRSVEFCCLTTEKKSRGPLPMSRRLIFQQEKWKEVSGIRIRLVRVLYRASECLLLRISKMVWAQGHCRSIWRIIPLGCSQSQQKRRDDQRTSNGNSKSQSPTMNSLTVTTYTFWSFNYCGC